MSEFIQFNPSECANEMTPANIHPLSQFVQLRAQDELQTKIHFQSLDKSASANTNTNTNANSRENEEGLLPIHGKIVDRLDSFIVKNKIPHIIFHGPSGSGKLTLVKSFIQRIYGGDKAKVKTHVMTVNCSHGKGIQFIREELKFFAKANTQSCLSSQPNEKKTGCDFKIILLLNAHHLTVDAQSALRRCIELFSYNTRFFIVLENKNKLLNPILSRFCDIFVPEPLDIVSGKPMNLHQYVLNTQFGNETVKLGGFTSENMSSKIDRMDNLAEILANGSNRGEQHMISQINVMYECGVSCMDLMQWVGMRRDQWTELEHSRAVMLFHEIKPQFRCEKLLMLYMLNFLYSHSIGRMADVSSNDNKDN